MLIIEPQAKSVMIEDAVNTFPNECCGFMLGHDEFDIKTVTWAIPVDNAKEGDQRRRFQISPVDYLKAERVAEDNNLVLLGVYHSHPNHPSVPSEHDRLSAQPYFSYVIVSVINNEFFSMQSWRLNDGQQFQEEKIAQVFFA